jgi:hypothetical protein
MGIRYSSNNMRAEPSQRCAAPEPATHALAPLDERKQEADKTRKRREIVDENTPILKPTHETTSSSSS